MHKNFGEWYRLVSIEPSGDTLTKRWAGVEGWVSTLRGDDTAILETVRIFQGMSPKAPREPFLAAFRRNDPAFPQRNELELRVLAGAALISCVQVGEAAEDARDGAVRAAIIAGTAVAASTIFVSGPQMSEVTGEVIASLQGIARSQRQRGELDTDEIRAEADAAAEAIKLVAATGDLNQAKGHISTALKALLNAVRGAESALTTAAHSLRCADEETDILWWLEGGSSRDLLEPWSAVPMDAVPLIAASELADLTKVALGPQDAAAILHRVVTKAKCQETSIQAYVNAVPDEWVKARGVQMVDDALDLAPLSLALSHRASSNSSSWQQFFEGRSGVKASTSLAPERVAHQAYLEAVLLRTLAEGG